MNITTLNTTTLDGGVIIKKGEGGGGATINNQDKVVDITENGTTEVVADGGFTGLGKVTINTEVSGGESGGSETMYFAAKDGGAMGFITEMALMGGFAVKKADNTISSIGTFLLAGDYSPEALISVKAIAFALGNYITGGGADISNPDTLRGLMFQLNGKEGMPEIIEITKEQFYDLNA